MGGGREPEREGEGGEQLGGRGELREGAGLARHAEAEPQTYLHITNVLPAPKWLKHTVTEAQYGQVLNELLACRHAGQYLSFQLVYDPG